MAFEKYTAPPPPPPPPPKPKPQIKFVRTVIQFTEDGLAHLGEIAGKLKDASHVHLWHDPDTNQVAITPAPADDPDAFTLANGRIQAKKFFEQMKIAWPVKQHNKLLDPHEEGVKVTIGAPPAPVTRRRAASATREVTPIPKSTSTGKKRGRPSKAETEAKAAAGDDSSGG